MTAYTTCRGRNWRVRKRTTVTFSPKFDSTYTAMVHRLGLRQGKTVEKTVIFMARVLFYLPDENL